MDPFEIIRAARACQSAAIPADNNPSDTTVKDYQRVADRLIGTGGGDADRVIERAAQTTSARTWFKRRAALLWDATSAIRELLAKQDQLQRKMRATPNDAELKGEWLALIECLEFYTQLATRMPTGCPIPEEHRQRRHSKKHDLAGLPPDWRERLYRRMDKYALPYLVTAITGCRPAELATGVVLGIQNGELVAIINGKKVKERQGQPWRELAWTLPRDGLVGMLAELVQQQGNEMEVQIDDPRAFSTSVRDAARREWSQRKKTVTPYSLRHQFSADIKAAGLPRKEVAAAMGQVIDTTCQHYGTANQAGSISVAPNRVNAARPVREHFVHRPPNAKTPSLNHKACRR